MKKKLMICYIIAALLFGSVFLYGCKSTEFDITYRVGESVYKTLTAKTTEETLINYTGAPEGYELEGWYFSDDGGETLKDKLTESTKFESGKQYTVYAKITGIPYIIRYHSEEAYTTGEMEDQILEYDTEEPLRKNVFHRPGYSFEGWSHTKGSDTADFDDEEMVENLSSRKNDVIDLYAVWERDESKTIIHYFSEENAELFVQEMNKNTEFLSYNYQPAGNLDLEGWVDESDTFMDDTIIREENLKVYARTMAPGFAFDVQRGGMPGAYDYHTILTAYTGNEAQLEIPFTFRDRPIDEIGAEAFWGKTTLTGLTIPYAVTKIGKQAFSGCTALKTVTLPANLEEIDEGAFIQCSVLENLDFSDTKLKSVGKDAFYGCVAFTEIGLPASVESIGHGAFRVALTVQNYEGKRAMYNTVNRLEKLTIPFIGGDRTENNYIAYIFGGEPESNWYDSEGRNVAGQTEKIYYHTILPQSLKAIVISEDCAVTADAFNACFFLQTITLSGAQQVGARAFNNCFGLKTVTGLEDVTFIDEDAFYATSSLENHTLNNLEQVGEYAFAGSSITQVPYGSKIEVIDDFAFFYTKISSVTFPASITSVGSFAFYECLDLKEVIIQKDYTFMIGQQMFHHQTGVPNILIWVPDNTEDNKPYMNYRQGTAWLDYNSLIFPIASKGQTGIVMDGDIVVGYIGSADTITLTAGKVIADYAFAHKKTLKTVVLPPELEYINRYAFYECHALENMDFPATLKEIGDNAYAGYLSGNEMTKVLLPEGFTRLGSGAFLLGYKVETIRIPSTIEFIGYLAFGASSSLEKCFIFATTPPEVGRYRDEEEGDQQVFAYVKEGITEIFVPGGKSSDPEHLGMTYAEIYKTTPGFTNVADFIKALPGSIEAGTYGDGLNRVVLDGNGNIDITFEGQETPVAGYYELDGEDLEIELPLVANIAAKMIERVITFEHEGTAFDLREPKQYNDPVEWSNFYLYEHTGRGEFDYARYFYTRFTYTIEDTVFKMLFDGKNGPDNPGPLPEEGVAPEEFWGTAEYTGTYVDDTIEITFYLNNWLSSFIFARYQPSYNEELVGVYKAFTTGADEQQHLMYTLELFADGTGTFAIGTSAAYPLTYVATGDMLVTKMFKMEMFFDILDNGDLYANPYESGFIVFQKQ